MFRDFDVVPSREDNAWFWPFYDGGQWEVTTIEEADRLLSPGMLLYDVGAFIGPLTLHEAMRGVRVLALEPDMGAYAELSQNIYLNRLGRLAIPLQIALLDDRKRMTLHIRGVGGNAYSSITKQAEFTDHYDVSVGSYDLMTEAYGKPDVIKIDVEGAESIILPFWGPKWRADGIPLLLALHEQWYPVGTQEDMRIELENWDLKDLRNSMYLATPK